MTDRPQPGERVEFDDHSGSQQTGTVAGILSNPMAPHGYWFLIDRDDGNRGGGGPNGEWTIGGDAWEAPKPWYAIRHYVEAPSHIPGLSSETIDCDAYREFMRGL